MLTCNGRAARIDKWKRECRRHRQCQQQDKNKKWTEHPNPPAIHSTHTQTPKLCSWKYIYKVSRRKRSFVFFFFALPRKQKFVEIHLDGSFDWLSWNKYKIRYEVDNKHNKHQTTPKCIFQGISNNISQPIFLL